MNCRFQFISGNSKVFQNVILYLAQTVIQIIVIIEKSALDAGFFHLLFAEILAVRQKSAA